MDDIRSAQKIGRGTHGPPHPYPYLYTQPIVNLFFLNLFCFKYGKDLKLPLENPGDLF